MAGEGRLQGTRIYPPVAQAKEGSVEALGAAAAPPARKEGLERIDLVRSSEEPRTPPPCGGDIRPLLAQSSMDWSLFQVLGRQNAQAPTPLMQSADAQVAQPSMPL